jgi:hypothetical protein
MPHIEALTVACTRCGRQDRYRVTTLAATRACPTFSRRPADANRATDPRRQAASVKLGVAQLRPSQGLAFLP